MRINALRRLALVSVVGVLAVDCADPARSVAPPVATPSLLIEETTIPPTTDGPTSALEPLRVLIETALLTPYYLPATLDEAYRLATGDCAKSAALLGVALDAYAYLLTNEVEPTVGTTWEALAQAVVTDLGAECELTLPAGTLGPDAIVRYVKAADGAQLRSPNELVALNIPAGAMGGDALVVVTREPWTAPNPRLLGTTLPQYGPVYQVATYPATTISTNTAISRLELFVVGSSPTLVRAPSGAENSLAIVLAPGSGSSNTGVTAVITRPDFCAVLTDRTGQWGGADFLKLTPTATWASSASDLSRVGSSVAFLDDSASTSGSGCGQAPPAFDGGSLRADAPGTREPGIAFLRSASDGVSLPDNRIGTFGVVRIYDPTLSTQVRAGLSARICAGVATLTNTTGQDVVAVIDPVNRATGRWSSWKLPVLVPPGGATAVLPLGDRDTKSGEVQLSYGPESLAHVGLSSGCP